MDKEIIINKIKISSPDKILFNKKNITKKDVALYYQKVSESMLPYIKDRLISTVRCPEGVDGECFYKKHLGKHNQGIKKINIPNDNDNKEDYYYIVNSSGIISEVQMNTIEFHIWGSIVNNINKPDMMVFDLDPDDKLDLNKIREGVKDLKSLLDQLSLISFLKTSGSKGYHIVVPFSNSPSWEKFSSFAKNVAILMEEKWPDKYTSNVRKNKRQNKIFIDWIRNNKSATSIAPYSIRTKQNATVSMPIKWSELDKIAPDDITMQEAIRRLKNKDPWENFFEIKQQIK